MVSSSEGGVPREAAHATRDAGGAIGDVDVPFVSLGGTAPFRSASAAREIRVRIWLTSVIARQFATVHGGDLTSVSEGNVPCRRVYQFS